MKTPNIKNIHKVVITKKELLEIVDAISTYLSKEAMVALKDTEKEAKNRKDVNKLPIFEKFNFKNDTDIIKEIESAIKKYLKILPGLKAKIAEELPENIVTTSHDINIKLAIGLVSYGAYFTTTIVPVLTYIVEKYYLKTALTVKAGFNHMVTLVNFSRTINNSELDKMVDAIGNVPSLTTLKVENVSVIPSEMIMGFFKNTFKINKFSTTNLIRKILHITEHKKQSTIKDMTGSSFIGNPIYHLRLLWTDLQLLRLDNLRERKRLLELRLLELQNNTNNTPNDKIQKQIDYYKDKIEKLDIKLRRLMEVD